MRVSSYVLCADAADVAASPSEANTSSPSSPASAAGAAAHPAAATVVYYHLISRVSYDYTRSSPPSPLI